MFLLILLFIICCTFVVRGGAEKKRTFRDFCFPVRYKLQKQQKSLGKYFTPEKIEKRGINTLLVFHKIGSGKTCTAIQIASNFIFKNAVPLFVMPASLIPNFIDEINTPCGTRLTKYNMLSFNKALTNMPRSSDISIIIIDEFQNITNEKGSFFGALIKLIEQHPEIPVVIMSGTPIFDNIKEVHSMLRLLRINADYENLDLLNIKGHISYYAGAPKFTFPRVNTKLLKCKMSGFQAKWYAAQVEAEMKKDKVVISTVPNNFYIKSRQKSNISFGDKIDISMKKVNDDLEKYSSKFYALFKKLTRGKLSFIYTNFTNKYGIETLCKLLELRGFFDFKKMGPGKKRFAVWSGNETQKEKKNIKQTFNSSANNDSSQLQIIIGSAAIKEGVSLYRVANVHILDMYWNYSRLEQIYGRAIRFCSHKMLPDKERKVNLYLYAAVNTFQKNHDEHYSIDLLMLDIAEEKRKANEIYIDFFQKNSIEYQRR